MVLLLVVVVVTVVVLEVVIKPQSVQSKLGYIERVVAGNAFGIIFGVGCFWLIPDIRRLLSMSS